MKRFCRRLLCMALTLALTVPPHAFVHAEDIDLFAGGSTASGANPNVLFILDNSANWSAASQHWTDASKQGQSELRALKTVVGGLDETINVGLMMFTSASSSSNKDGAYVRFAIRPMNATNKAALQELIGDENCVDGANSLNGTPNCIFKNFDSPSEKINTASTDYSAALFEAFKYFGGYTKPGSSTAGSPIVTTVPSDGFGPYRYAGNPDGKDDPAAFDPSSQRTKYLPPIDSANNCAKNFIIFVGNGFPVQDSPATLLSGLTGTTPTQLSMPVLSTTVGPVTTTLLPSTGSVCETAATCATRAATLFPNQNSYACTGGNTSVGTTTNLGTDSTCESASACATRASTSFPGLSPYSCTGGTATTPTVTLGTSGFCETAAACATRAATSFPGYTAGTYACTGGTTSAGAVTTLQADTGTVCETAAACATRAASLFPGYTPYSCTGGSTSTGTTTTLEASTTVCETQAQCVTRAQTAYPGQTTYSCTGGAASAGTTVTLVADTGTTCETPTQCQTRIAGLFPGYTSYSCTGGNTITGSGGCTGQNRVHQTATAISGYCASPSLRGQLMTGTSGVCSSPNLTHQAMIGTTGACPGPTSLTGWTVTAQTACIANQTMQGTSGVCTSPNLINQSMTGTVNAITVTDTGTFGTPSTATARWTDEWAKFLYTTDVNGATGQQNTKIYTLDVFKDAQDARQTQLLFNMAKVGGGHYYQASSEEAILIAVKAALIDIQATNTVFAAASLPVSATNRAQNENQVFFGLFRPDGSAQPRWYGNLKRYQVAKATGGLVLADANGADAVNDASGFFTPCAASFWTTDTGTYWNFSPTSAGQCTTATTDVFSDLPDGPLVEKGGAAEILRRGNNPASPTNVVNRTMYTCASTASCSSMVALCGAAGVACTTSNANVSMSALGAADSTEQINILRYTLGHDLGGLGGGTEIPTGSTNNPRPSIHGDIVHSRPLPVNYGSPTGVVVYYGGNDGPLRAVKTSDGTELWSFIAPEHHTKLKRLRDNSPIISYPPPASGSQKKDYFFDGTLGLYQTATNDAVWVFPTMRRGGRMLYAFDVTNPTSPALKWRKGCPGDLTTDAGCDTDFSGIGQTWSTPNVAFVKGYDNGATPVLVVGGGYDTCEDSDSASPSCSSPKGNKVYVINALTGDLLARFDTDRSVPADVALVDRDFDTFVDHAYIADTGGNLYRIDFVNPASAGLNRLVNPSDGLGKSCDSATAGDWCITKIAATTSTTGRKFQFPPAVFPSTGQVILTLGTGDRERPLVGNYPYTTPVSNSFYMFKDKFPATGSPAVDLDTSDATKISDVTDTASTCTGELGWRMTLPSRGEQVVTSSLITGGRVFFNTARALAAPAGSCAADLGEAKGYNVNLLCGADRFSVVYQGGGLPISPVQGTTTLADGSVVTFVIGGPPDTSATSPFTPGQIKPVVSPRRSRLYWYRQGDK